jgi:hypothetical protein
MNEGLQPDRNEHVTVAQVIPGALFVTAHGITREVVAVQDDIVTFRIAGSGNFGGPARASMSNFLAEVRVKAG